MRLDARSRIMIPRHNDNMHLRISSVQMHKLIRECFPCSGRRLLNVEHISTNYQCIGLLFTTPLLQLRKIIVMLIAPFIILIDDLA